MRTVIILLFQLFIIQSIAQPSFIREDKLWSQVRYSSTEGYPYTTKYTKFEGDTLINGYTYSKVFESWDEDMMNWEMVGFIRETDTFSVFYCDKYDQTERLLYDFGMQIGEGIPMPWSETEQFLLDSIRTQPFGIYQEPRKHFYFSYNGGSLVDVWIEGIGSLKGVLTGLEFYGFVGEYRELLCFSENDSLKYIFEKYNTCYFNNTRVEERLTEKIYIVYNNQSLIIDYVRLRLDRHQFSLFDITGRKVLYWELPLQDQVILEVPDLSKGIYVYYLGSNQSSFSGKILVQ